jgi:hypothetical protein
VHQHDGQSVSLRSAPGGVERYDAGERLRIQDDQVVGVEVGEFRELVAE